MEENAAKRKTKNKDNGKDTGLMFFKQVLLKLSCCLEFLHLGEEGGGGGGGSDIGPFEVRTNL